MSKLGLCLIAGSVFFLVRCGEAPSGDSAITDTTDSLAGDGSGKEQTASQVKTVFKAVPSPMEMASMLKKSGAQYDASMLNDVKKVNSYNTARSQALNLGIYGANLSYTSVFNQNQESIIYLSCAKKLADNLGVSKAFDEETIERMESNIDNRDSLLNIVSEAYYMLDAYLKENDREHISALVVAAGWIEGLHISTSVARSSSQPSEELVTRIADQKISLTNLLEMVEAYNKNNQIEEVYQDLITLQNIFNEVVVITKGSSGVEEGSDGVATIGAKTKTQIKPDGIQMIHDAVVDIRTRYVS